MENTYKIIPNRGHFEVYDSNGKFVLSGDNWDECYNGLTEIIIAQARAKINAERGGELTA